MLKKLRDQIGQKRERAKALLDLCTAETRSLTEAELTESTTLLSEIEELDTQIRTQERLQLVSLQGVAPVDMATQGNESANDRNDVAKFSFLRAINNNEKLDGVELEMHQEGIKQLRMINQVPTGIAIPEIVTRAGQSIAVPADGGNSVYTEYKGFKEFFRQALVVQDLGATVITGLQGNLSYVTEQNQIAATWEGESTTASETSFQVANLQSSPKRLAKVLKYTKQLLAQSVLDIESRVQMQIAYALAYALQDAGLGGTGVGNIPMGILNAAGVQSIALGVNGGALSYAQIVAMETLVADKDALQGSLGYVMNAVTRGKLKTTEVTPTSPSGRFLMPTDGSLNGYKTALTNYMPKAGTKGTGTNLSSMIFGDFSQLEFHRWGAIDLTVDRITLADQAQVKVTVNDFANVLIVRPSSFVKVTDINTTP